MQEFIKLAMSQLGTSEDTTKAATGGILKFLAQNAPSGDVQQLMAKLPGAQQLMSEAPEPAAVGTTASGGGGMLGSLMNKVTGALGGGGAAMGLLGTLTSTGLDAGKAGSLVTMFVNFAREKAGADLVNRLMSNVPALAAMAK